MTVLVLASKSPARLATLRSAGIEPFVLVSDVDGTLVDRYGIRWLIGFHPDD